MKYPLIIFDFDGTLADSLPFFIGAMEKVATRFGDRPLEPQDLAMLRQLGPREALDYLGLPLWKLPVMVRYARELMAQRVESISLFPGVEDLLRQLYEKGVTVCIVSSNSEENVRGVLGPANAGRVKVYECGTSVFGKARRFRRVLARTGFAAAQALAIGDEIRDIEAARAAGIACGAVAWGYADVEALLAREPQFVFGEVQEILAV